MFFLGYTVQVVIKQYYLELTLVIILTSHANYIVKILGNSHNTMVTEVHQGS